MDQLAGALNALVFVFWLFLFFKNMGAHVDVDAYLFRDYAHESRFVKALERIAEAIERDQR